MLIVVVAVSVLAFLVAFQYLAIISKAQEAVSTSRQTAAVMGNAEMDEDAKEAAVQKAALDLMKCFVSLVVRGGGALLAAWVPIQAADWAGLVPAEATLAFLLRIDVIVITSVLLIVVVFVGRRVWPR